MTSDLDIFAARLRDFIGICADEFVSGGLVSDPALQAHADAEFNGMALVLFALQFNHNPAYRKLCEARGVRPDDLTHWKQIPAAPTAAFKELDLTCLPQPQRTHVFHSSGTTEQQPSRHFHNAESLAVYEASLWPWFVQNLRLPIADCRLGILTPPPAQAPRSSLVHMFDLVRRKLGADESAFYGRIGNDGLWTLDLEKTLPLLNKIIASGNSALLLGTAFSFVHLLDHLAEKKMTLALPPGSRVMETGGYKGRSRTLPKAELHALITSRLCMPPSNIVCEYGMSELSSQAYDCVAGDECRVTSGEKASRHPSPVTRHFHFPPWARAQIISPETGLEVADGETGLIRVFDLANVFSVMVIQTEDLAVRRNDGFELIGRAQFAEARGCSLMAV